MQKRFRLSGLLIVSSLAFLVKVLVLLLPMYLHAGVWSVYLSQGVQLMGYAIFIPAVSFFLNGRMDAGDKVKGQMLVTESQTLGCILGQLVGGFAIASLGLPATTLIGCVLTAAGAGLVALAVHHPGPDLPAGCETTEKNNG